MEINGATICGGIAAGDTGVEDHRGVLKLKHIIITAAAAAKIAAICGKQARNGAAQYASVLPVFSTLDLHQGVCE